MDNMSADRPELKGQDNYNKQRIISLLLKAGIIMIVIFVLVKINGLLISSNYTLRIFPIKTTPTSQLGERVKDSVIATFPTYCNWPGDEISVYPHYEQPSEGQSSTVEEWRVTCHMHETLRTCQPLIRVYVSECEARVTTAFDGAYTRRLVFCP
jgi:hypothetical protein